MDSWESDIALLDADFLASLVDVNPDTVRQNFGFESPTQPATQSAAAANNHNGWQCAMCTTRNPSSISVCSACYSDWPAEGVTAQTATPATNHNGWQCAMCTTRNPSHHSICSVCYSDRPAQAQPANEQPPANEQGGPPTVNMEIRCKPPGTSPMQLMQLTGTESECRSYVHRKEWAVLGHSGRSRASRRSTVGCRPHQRAVWGRHRSAYFSSSGVGGVSTRASC